MARRDRNTLDMFDWADAQPMKERAAIPSVEPQENPQSSTLRKTALGSAQRNCASSASDDLDLPIDFLRRRKSLGRWILNPDRAIAAYERGILREAGQLPPAPILAFPDRHPAWRGAYRPDPDPAARAS